MKKLPVVVIAVLFFGAIGWWSGQSYFSHQTAQASDGGRPGQGEAGPSSADEAAPTKKQTVLPAVRVEIVNAAPLTQKLSLTGAVVPTRTARLASPGEGPIEACAVTECMVREGDQVERGQVLLQISRNKAARAQLDAAEQALAEQELDLQRITQLVQGGAIPGAQLDTARSRYESARAQLAKAQESAEDYLITAPWPGIVATVFVTEGDYVAPRTPLIELFDPASLVVQCEVPESRATEVAAGLPVELRFDAHPGALFNGTVSRVYPQLDERTHTRTVEVSVGDQVELLPGMFVRLQVALAHLVDAVTVPTYSLVAMANGEQAVFILDDQQVVRRPVRLGAEIDGRVQILSGVRPGDRVVVAGQEKLKDGARVTVQEAAAAATGAADRSSRS